MNNFFASLKDRTEKVAEHENDNSVNDPLAKLSPGERYQQLKKAWYWLKSSWYRRGLDCDDNQGCDSELVV
jgi:hypothetical protein